MPLATPRWFRNALLCCCSAAIVGASLSAACGAERVDKTAIFTAGEEGYKLYRIPGLVVTSRGTLLAYCEARKSDRGDWGPIDILLRRSTDGGKTWQPRQHVAHHGARVPKNPAALAQKLAKEDDQTVNNPVAIVDADGAVHFLYCVEYARCFYQRSDDDGETWTKPVDITPTFEQFRPEYEWKVIATGPGHGIQLHDNQDHAGRLVVAIWMSTGTGGHAHRPSVTATIFSDDHGRTWGRGAIAVPNTEEFVNPNETSLVELADGRVLLNVRSESKANRRLLTASPDGAGGWSPPEFNADLLEPICMASMARLSLPRPDRQGLLFANPNTLDAAPGKQAAPGANRARKNLSIKLSYDEGQTWPVTKLLEDGLSGYSDLAVGPDGTIYCFYEAASTGQSHYATGRLVLARFNLEWLTGGRE
jgi:sialidase-1